MEATLAVFICVAALLPSTAVSRCDSQGVTTSPPISSILPLGPETSTYVRMICSDQTQECGKLCQHSFVFDLSCSEGYVSNTLGGSSLYTLHLNGSWTPRLPQCKRWCKPLKSENVNIRCNYEGYDVGCNQPLPAGTEATGRCKVGYLPTGNATDFRIVCRGNGEWSHELFDCVATACGRKTPYSTESVDPWFIVIYRDNSLVCLGTLISPHIVLAVPNCFNESAEEPISVVSPSRFVVTVGKKVNGWRLQRPRGETIQVRQISVPSQYIGSVTNYAFGIALIDLETSVTSMPACVDWGREFDITPGHRGTVPAWDASANLHHVQADYVDYVSCVSDLRLRSNYDRIRLVTPDKFCFKVINIPIIPLGMAGSGYMFEQNGLHYVKGVMMEWLEFDGIVYSCTATSLGNRDLLHWLHQTTRSFDAYHNGA